MNKIVQKLVEFNPDDYLCRSTKEFSDVTNEIYQEYKLDQTKTTNWTEEINSIAFEVWKIIGS